MNIVFKREVKDNRYVKFTARNILKAEDVYTEISIESEKAMLLDKSLKEILLDCYWREVSKCVGVVIDNV